MKFDFDVIVIGSGFGGSVMTCRLVEKAYKICLLERGRQWNKQEFPRRIDEIKKDFFWDPKDNQYGLMEMRDYPGSDMTSITASGLGGGSLIYANVLLRMPEDFFKGWPLGLTRKSLDPYYDKVEKTMQASPYPFETDPYYRDTPKTQALKDAANLMTKPSAAKKKPEFILPPLAINFRGVFPAEQTKNLHGAVQSRCNKCGECDIGCNIHAKNTLDLNYLYRARNKDLFKNAAEVRTDAEVTKIIPLAGGGYEVTYVNPKSKSEVTKITAERVVVSAGSLGSTVLLLKMKKQKYLPQLNEFLGKNWCGNGDLLGAVINTTHNIDCTKGPVITGAIQYRYEDYPDGFPHGMYIQDAGYPVGLAWYLASKMPSVRGIIQSLKLVCRYFVSGICRILKIKYKTKEINLGDDMAKTLSEDEFFRKSFLMLGMGRDRSDGEIKLRSDNEPIIDWRIEKSKLHYDRLREQMGQIAKNLNGVFFDNPLTLINKVVAVHPLGGCPMADSAQSGFVNTKGEVFGYPGLHVVDASILPTSVGPNPSLTIAAVAEYIAEQFPQK